jgi:hypothetical protein
MTTLSVFRWSIKRLQPVSDLRVTGVGNSTGRWNSIPADLTLMYKTGFWRNSAMTSPATSYTKNVANKLSFLLITPTIRFDIRFGCYGVLKSCFSSGQVIDRLDCIVWSGFWATRWLRLARVWIQLLKKTKSVFRRLLKHTFLITVATVMAI